MSKYEVRDVVCDYGVFENGELIPQLILNSRRNALTICDILKADEEHKVLALEEERKHGHWVKEYDFEKYFRHCSNCGYIKRRQNLRQTFPNFCEKCGAIMDEVSEDEKI